KKQLFNNYDDDRIKNIQLKINRKPKKKLNFEESFKCVLQFFARKIDR
ncbi:hypothetical protein EZS27_037747, partial [termite gut metagenome]